MQLRSWSTFLECFVNFENNNKQAMFIGFRFLWVQPQTLGYQKPHTWPNNPSCYWLNNITVANMQLSAPKPARGMADFWLPQTTSTETATFLFSCTFRRHSALTITICPYPIDHDGKHTNTSHITLISEAIRIIRLETFACGFSVSAKK